MRPLYIQLYEEFRDKIIEGEYRAGTRLPSKRNLSADLNLSGTTIEHAYQTLMDEGYIYSKPRSGFFVSQIEQLPITRKHEPSLIHKEEEYFNYEFKTAQVDPTHFPYAQFRQLSRKAFEDENMELLISGDKEGYWPLRQAIAQYVFNSRGVKCTPNQVIVGSSTEQLSELITEILKTNRFLIEDPSYPPIRNVLEKKKIAYQNVPVIEHGIDMNIVEKSNFETVYVTPSHQFPTGEVMSIENRTRLIKWANKSKSRYIIEDDYDSEFRYFKKPLPALQSLDTKNKVIYISTFSKSLFPTVRIAYMVLPKHLIQKYQSLKHKENSTVSLHMQWIVSEFLRTGRFDRHLNKMRKVYENKISYIIKRLNEHPVISVRGEKTGMHFVLTVQDGDLNTILERAEKESLYIEPFKTYAEKTTSAKFVIGFGGVREEELEEHMDVLIRVLLGF
ncbi:PLP-dependent aminotransferase family protein [Phocicoccus pinnipedialis]|uniref:HTH-type transcriptional regulatory protein GabR n=1 Tax=Phocicoccus pinnipedialis TaxID=110845 RepID=A0A6V7R4Y8_9BACL|nr:PLP-dependent aminotransferase family protein [Jeotgalicoccus pinnipedialis]MBP1939974.1 GntR family transcriptional regulator/MocR family aminotransferase [Jeotgalicoccus pinnipedialis]CAD2072078.1 HTH-type transcriptional regulatory protein GabR [Jeotgalicoccus pinnipedialis]